MNSEDAYGSSGMQDFTTAAAATGIKVLASTSFVNDEVDFSSSIDVLRRSGAMVVVLFCQGPDAARFIQAMQAKGGDNITWVGSESVTPAVRAMVTSSSDQAARLRGFVGMAQSGGFGKVHTTFTEKLSAFQTTIFGEGWCSTATDDDGQLLWSTDAGGCVQTTIFGEGWCSTATDDDGRLLWSTDAGGCVWAGGDTSVDFYAPFAYDAVYAMAHAVSRTLAAANGTSLDGATLMTHLLSTTFAGATGLVGFDEHGDRTMGISYEVHSVAGQVMALLGHWQSGNTWNERFASGSLASYVAADGSSRAPTLASSPQLLRLGVLCEAQDSVDNRVREACDHVHHTVDRLNDKTDGWYDGLLPNHTIVTATRSVGCVEERARSGWRALQELLGSFEAVIGPSCSNDVADVAGLEWREGNGSRAVVISPISTAPILSDETKYPNLARTISTDEHQGSAFAELCFTLGWDRVAIVHDDSVWGVGGAAMFRSFFEAGNGIILPDGVVNFRLADFDAGTVHARDLLVRLQAASARVVVVVTQLRVQRALYAWAADHDLLFGPGYGWVTFWASEGSMVNADGSTNASAVKGAEGLIGLMPSTLSGADAVVEPLVQGWRRASSSSCNGVAYCDADGDATSWPGYSATIVDAVLVYAHAMDRLRLTAPQSMGDADALYAAILKQPAFEGAAGPVHLGNDGDRLGRLKVINMQMAIGQRRRLASSVSLGEVIAAFVEVGDYDALTKNMTVSHPIPLSRVPHIPLAVHQTRRTPFTRACEQVSEADLVFSQGTKEVPVTTRPPSPPPPRPPPALPPASPPAPQTTPVGDLAALFPRTLALIVSIAAFLFLLLLGLAAHLLHHRRHRKKEFREQHEKRRNSMAPDRFKPLIYELDADTVFKLMESEKRCRRARISIALLERVQALSRSSPVDSLAQQIRQVQVRLEQERNSRVGDKDNGKLRDELIQKCLEVIKKGGASKAVYEAVFRTIVQGEREAMFSKYKASAKELSEALKEYPEACEQNTSGKPGEDLARLYMEAISVRERAQKVMNSIDSADGHNSIDSADGNRRRSVYQSGNDRRLEMAPLKMMRYALMPPTMPLPHLSSWSLVRAAAVAHAKRLCYSPGAAIKHILLLELGV